MKDLILGFESSCDETAVALVDDSGHIVGQEIASQISIHNQYGGVVPEVASRNHFTVVDSLLKKLFLNNPDALDRLDSVAATLGPGLVGPLLVGACYAQGFASGRGLRFRGVHHLRGHLASMLLRETSEAGPNAVSKLRERADQVFPGLVLLVSGGHTQILEVGSRLQARKIIESVDDAAGECFDKSAKLMGMGYPGGPAIERLALELKPSDEANARELLKKLPKPKTEQGDFSFSGLKTAIRLLLERDSTLANTPAFCWALQERICELIISGLSRSFSKATSVKSLGFCGGVSANRRLRSAVQQWATERGLEFMVPPLSFCTDNAAMIAAAAWVQDPTLELLRVSARPTLEPS